MTITEGARLMRELAEIHGTMHLNDLLPVLQWIDFQGTEMRIVGQFESL